MSWKACDLALAAALAAVYFGAARLGLSLASEYSTAVWPPTGIAVVVLLLIGTRVWPGVLLRAFAASATRGDAPATAAGIAIGNTAGPVACALLLRRVARFDPTLAR